MTGVRNAVQSAQRCLVRIPRQAKAVTRYAERVDEGRHGHLQVTDVVVQLRAEGLDLLWCPSDQLGGRGDWGTIRRGGGGADMEKAPQADGDVNERL